MKLLLLIAIAAQSQDTSWSDLYRRDLDAVRTVIEADHPGARDSLNPQFARSLQTEYRRSADAAPAVDSYNAYRYQLTRFVNTFQDEHLGLAFKRPFEGMRHAGINVRYQSGEYRVLDVDSALYDASHQRLAGAKLTACDGMPARRVFLERVLSWRGRANIEADWYRLAPLFFVDYGRPTPAPPQRCTFVGDADTTVLPLVWVDVSAQQLNERVARAIAFDAPPIAVRRPENGVLWFTLPTFSVFREPELSAMRALVDSARAARNGDWRLLVLDLRGNAGGSSTWGDEFASALFGETWIEQARDWLFDGVYTEWRVSPNNVENARGIANMVAQREGQDSRIARGQFAIADSMEAALRRGEAYYVPARRVRAGAPRPTPTRVPGKIVVVTGATCFSACLDFLDRFRLHPAVVHAGQTTGVDTNYMENWGREVSDLVTLGHPMKVYRNRRRANNEAYVPQVKVDGDLYDDRALEEALLRKF